MATYAHQASYEYSRAQYSHSNFGHSSYPKPTSQYGISGSNGSYQSEYGGYGGSDSIQSYKPAASSYGSYGAGGTGYGVSSAGYGARGGSGAGSYGAGYGASGGSGAGSYGAGGGSYGGGNYDGSATHMNYNVAGASSYGVQEKPQGSLCQTEALNDPFFALAPSSFPPGTDPKIIECFNNIDRDRNGLIDDRELQSALSNYNQSFNMRTVHLLMYMFTHSHSKTIGPKEFAPLLHNLGKWKALFQRSDKDRNGRIDITELREALCSMGFPVSTMILNLVISKYDKHGGKRAIGYDSFIEACLTIQGLTEKFRAKEDPCSGTASFTYDEFLLSVLPFIFT